MKFVIIDLFAILVLIVFLYPSARAAPISSLIKHQRCHDFSQATLEGLRWDEDSEIPGLVLELGPGSTETGIGSVTSFPIETGFPFNNVIPSWNVVAPQGSGAVIELRAGQDGEAWTDWYELALWRTDGHGVSGKRKGEHGYVDADTLVLYQRHNTIQYRITLIGQRDASPRLTLFALCYSDTTQDINPELGRVYAERRLPVPFRSQQWASPAIRRRVCSPTSVSMVLDYYGQELSIDKAAQEVYDRYNGIYGNWPFNVALPGELGFEAYVTRFSNFAPIEHEIAQGFPVIVSIRFGHGELDGAPMGSTAGHIVVVIGFTAEGDVIVNDPAGGSEHTGQVVYRREQFRRAWRNGVAYIIHPRCGVETLSKE